VGLHLLEQKRDVFLTETERLGELLDLGERESPFGLAALDESGHGGAQAVLGRHGSLGAAIVSVATIISIKL
jgi:hypothetical protein